MFASDSFFGFFGQEQKINGKCKDKEREEEEKSSSLQVVNGCQQTGNGIYAIWGGGQDRNCSKAPVRRSVSAINIIVRIYLQPS